MLWLNIQPGAYVYIDELLLPAKDYQLPLNISAITSSLITKDEILFFTDPILEQALYIPTTTTRVFN